MSMAIPSSDPHTEYRQARPAPRPGRLRQEGLDGVDRNCAVWIHISPLLAMLVAGPLGVVAPLVIWLVRREQSSFVDDHGREVMNMMLTSLVYGLLCITVVAVPFVLVWGVITVISLIRGAIAAGNDEYFRYPMIIRFF